MQTPLNSAHAYVRERSSAVALFRRVAAEEVPAPHVLVVLDREHHWLSEALDFELGGTVDRDAMLLAASPRSLIEALADDARERPEIQEVRLRLTMYTPGQPAPLFVLAAGEFFFFGGDHVRGKA